MRRKNYLKTIAMYIFFPSSSFMKEGQALGRTQKWQFSVKPEAQLVCVSSVLSPQAVSRWCHCLHGTLCWFCPLATQPRPAGSCSWLHRAQLQVGSEGCPQTDWRGEQSFSGRKVWALPRGWRDGTWNKAALNREWCTCTSVAQLRVQLWHQEKSSSPRAVTTDCLHWGGPHPAGSENPRKGVQELSPKQQSASRDSPRSTHLPSSLVPLPAHLRVTTCKALCPWVPQDLHTWAVARQNTDLLWNLLSSCGWGEPWNRMGSHEIGCKHPRGVKDKWA